MGLFDRFRRYRGLPTDPTSGPGLSIYEHIKTHMRADGPGLTTGGDALPDEAKLASKSEIRWVAGGLDGAFGHHSGAKEADAASRELLGLIKVYCKSPGPEGKRRLYARLLEQHSIDWIDALLEKIPKAGLNADRLHQLARALATESADREPVKTGIAILGLFRNPYEREIHMTLGRHEEFTLYCAVAIRNTSPDPEHDLWELAKQVEGWGRIQCVDRLADTDNLQIKSWLLRKGYKNSVMNEYTAYTCATAGGMKRALQDEHVDDELLTATGEIIEALLTGGPAKDMDDYDDGAAVLDEYMKRFEGRARTIADFLRAHVIKSFVDDPGADWQKRASMGWSPELRARLLASIRTLLERTDWKPLVLQEITSADYSVMFHADQAAKKLGIDVWEFHWERLHSDPQNQIWWSFAAQTTARDRISRVVSLAEDVLPLSEIASGPADEMGLGEKFKAHTQLDWVLQALERFSGIGERILFTGLRSPVTRNRNMALRALSAWGRGHWPDGTEELLRDALKHEPNAQTRDIIQKVLGGTPLDPPRVVVP